MKARQEFYARYLKSLALAEREPGKHSWYRFEAKGEETEIYVYDEIGFYGIQSADFIRDLKGIKSSQIKLRMNTPGGVVTDGHAMFNALVEHPAQVTTHIDALAASMGSIIALAGSEKNGGGGIKMAKNAFYMIHNPWGFAIGDDDDMMHTAGILSKMKGVLADAYQEQTGKEKGDILALMKAETWYTAEEAKSAGFVNEVIGEAKEKATFDQSVFALFQNMPSAVLDGFREKPVDMSALAIKRRQLELLEHQ